MKRRYVVKILCKFSKDDPVVMRVIDLKRIFWFARPTDTSLFLGLVWPDLGSVDVRTCMQPQGRIWMEENRFDQVRISRFSPLHIIFLVRHGWMAMRRYPQFALLCPSTNLALDWGDDMESRSLEIEPLWEHQPFLFPHGLRSLFSVADEGVWRGEVEIIYEDHHSRDYEQIRVWGRVPDFHLGYSYFSKIKPHIPQCISRKNDWARPICFAWTGLGLALLTLGLFW